ncbi:hypothetical protein BDV28DRAFT_114744 [Aspergillus coremiiformis]|uniref:Uncharacterized protein n=1 Tax=Aspergillus coremiiformis TaxID=138285 RepID=A0A5N6Z627_9EURO|nr:hypothetical protein BDV28DRAFT_114744 [Aspergillus coremiiformis]
MSDSNDLRHNGTAAKRVHNHKSKWAYGGRTAFPHHDVSISDPVTRPAMPQTHSLKYTRLLQLDRKAKSNQVSTAAKFTLRHDIREALDSGPSDSSATEDVDEPSTAPDVLGNLPGDDSVKSYEVSGQTIFSDAITKAVERFETQETEKLVKEYEIITREGEIATGYLADDDFELVDHDHATL